MHPPLSPKSFPFPTPFTLECCDQTPRGIPVDNCNKNAPISTLSLPWKQPTINTFITRQLSVSAMTPSSVCACVCVCECVCVCFWTHCMVCLYTLYVVV